MMKINYHQRYKEEVQKIGSSKPSLLLHVCCGPCCSNIVKELSTIFKLTIYYSNSNIYPETEYRRRYQELLDFIAVFDPSIEVIEHTYNGLDYIDKIAVHANEREGGKRCYLCYSLRMKDAYQYASAHHFDYWTTVLSVSRHKNSQWINEIGGKFPTESTTFLFSDFKKENGYQKSVETARQYNLYRQDYCGCIYSYQALKEKHKKDEE